MDAATWAFLSTTVGKVMGNAGTYSFCFFHSFYFRSGIDCLLLAPISCNRYPNGCVYAGQWKGNQRHGKGTMTYINGEVYEGSWEEDQRHGSGVYHWKDGRADVCKFHRQKIVGDGCRWNPKRQSVWLLRDGEMVMESPVSVEFGMETAKKLGVQFP